MARFWKEPYTLEKARSLGIHEFEGGAIVRWDMEGYETELPLYVGEWEGKEHLMRYRNPEPKWIYFVHVCNFTFAFYSLVMMQAYLDYYSQKILPTRAQDAPHCNNDLRQHWSNRLPLYLREEPKRQKVVKALQTAIREFSK